MAELQEAEVIYRASDGSEEAWMVEVDFSSTPEVLLPDLVQALELGGNADDYNIQNVGTLKVPVLVLTDKARKRVGRVQKK